MNLTVLWQFILLPLLLTQLIELPIALLIIKEKPHWLIILSVIGLNFITNPLLNLFLFLSARSGIPLALSLVIGEIIVFIVEMAGFKLFLERVWSSCAKYALVLNGASFLIGLGLNYAHFIFKLLL
ncbi:MAG TPA: hypothetical protein GX717_08540 [Clostridiaceae bacterium]|nr:hypothetical protein [Clostridiaceae bacterium]